MTDDKVDGGVDRSLHPQNGRIGDEGLRLGEYLNYYRFPPVFVAIDGETKHDSPMCPELEGDYRMICRENALYAYGERWCETCKGHQKRVDFPANPERKLIADGGTDQSPVANLAVRDDLEAASSYAEEGAFDEALSKVQEAVSKIDGDGGELSLPIDEELEEAASWTERELREARRALWDGKTGKAFASIEAAQDEFETVAEAILND